MRRLRGFVAVVLFLGAALPVRALPRGVQRERDEIITLLAYSIVYLDSQTSTAASKAPLRLSLIASLLCT